MADYDAVILNLLSLEDSKSVDAETLTSVLNVRVALEVLSKRPGSSGSAAFVLGDPRFNIVEAPPDRSGEFRERWEVPFLAWTGLRFKWDNRPGDTIEREYGARDGAFKPFADKLERWRYSLEDCKVDFNRLHEFLPAGDVYDDNHELVAVVNDICTSRYNTSIVFSAQIGTEDSIYGHSGFRKQIVPVTEPIYFLPESGLSEEETLEFVLRDLCGVDVSAPEPEWVSEFVAPGQEEVDRELVELKDRIEELIGEHDRKIEERSERGVPSSCSTRRAWR